MDLTKAPEDQELRNIIDKLAQFVARNGLEFEQMTKNKQKDNQKFAFLFGGEYYNYYQYKVTTEQANVVHEAFASVLKQKQKAIEQQNISWQSLIEPQQVQEQIQQSERNLAAQHQMLIQQQQVEIDEAIRKIQDEKLQNLAKNVDIDLPELEKVMQPIIDSCTKDSISTGKGWIFNHAISPEHNNIIVQYLQKRVTAPGTSFELKLHLVYLINDVLHHCLKDLLFIPSLRKNADDLRSSLGAVVVPIFCTTCLAASEDQQQKLSKLLKLWESNNYFEVPILEQLKNPAAAVAAYQNNLIAECSSVITPITTAIQNQYAALQKQHQDFVTHITAQLHQQQQQQQQPSFNTVQPQGPVPLAVRHPSDMSSSPGTASPSPPDSTQSGNQSQTTVPPQFAQPPPNFPPNFSQPPPNFTHPPPGFLPPNFNQPPPNFQQPPLGIPPFASTGLAPGLPIPDFTKPPPGFLSHLPPPHQAPMVDLNDPNLMPSVPYYELPAGLMAPLVKMEETDYCPLDPDQIRLPPPAPPSDRLLAAVELFYSPPSHERPRNSEGWEQLGLYEFFKAKTTAKKTKEDEIKEGKRIPSPKTTRQQNQERFFRSRSRSPNRRRYNEQIKGRSRSKSPSPRLYKRTSRSRSQSISPPRAKQRSPSPPPANRGPRSPTPPSFFGSTYGSAGTENRLGETNKGHQLLKKMGWGGQGLGAAEQGIHEPIDAGDVRDRQDQYKGIGINLNDPFETFRKSKGQAFINRMRARAEEKQAH
uniref:Calcium homeostasis endoplasmic reticulum protein n=1 Tax=Strigamia maritima TaxID=126957 RepID=T1IH20_STRMM